MVGLHALVVGLFSLTVMRMLAFGISNGLSPITNAYVAEAAPARFRGLLVALLQCGYPIGWFVASLFVAPLIATWGWRYIFLPALLVIPIAFVIARYLPESRRFQVARREAKTQHAAGKPRHFLATLAPLFRPEFRFKTLACFSAFFLFGGAYAGTAFYFPSYFNEFRGYSIEVATSIVGLSYGVGVLGYFAVAIIGEFYMTRRNTCALWALLGCLATIGLLWLPDSYMEDVIWFGLMAGFFYGNAAALSMLLVETFPTHIRATAAAFAGSFALNLGHATFPLLVAYAIPVIGWQWSFTLAVVPSMAIAGLAILTLKNMPSGLDVDEVAARA
jgi:MFS family permease